MKTFLITLSLTAAAMPAFGAMIDPNLSGNVRADEWDFGQPLLGGPYGGFNSTAAWPGGIDSNVQGVDALFNKTGGYGFATGNSIYVGSMSDGDNLYGGSFSVSEAHPVADLKTVVFQLDIIEAHGYDFQNHTLPALNYNGGAQSLTADVSDLLSQVDSGTFLNPQTNQEEPLYRNTWLLQWNLTNAAAPITSFDVDWSTVMHAQMYTARLDQSNDYVAVPEPAMLGLLSLAGLTLLRRRSR